MRTICTILTLLLCIMQATRIPASTRQPNFVILLMDDVGYGDITSFWNPNNLSASTPFVDYMAGKGIRFVDFNSASSNCAPSRASLLTARLGARTGLTNVLLPTTQGGLPTNETTFGETFSKAGYKTGLIGKWHMGQRGDFHPTSRGFDFYFGLPYSPRMGCADEVGFSVDSPDPCPNDWYEIPGYSDSECYLCPSKEGRHFPALPLLNGRRIVEQPLNMTNLSVCYIQAAEMFIRDREMTTPFLLYVGLQHMLAPFYHMPEFTGRSALGNAYGDTLLEMDWVIETIVNVVKNNGEASNTLIWVTSDNGPEEEQCQYGGDPGPFIGQWQKATGGGGSSAKMTVWEGGHRVPALAFWPGTIEGGRVSDELVSIMDIYPTLASLAGINMPNNIIYDGIDISNILLNKPFTSENRVLYHPLNEYLNTDNNREMGAVRLGDFKAVFMTGGIPECGGHIGPSLRHDHPLIFNVKEDPMESNPIDPGSTEYQIILQKVNQALADLERSLQQDNTHVVDYPLNPCAVLCCNPLNVVCRCD